MAMSESRRRVAERAEDLEQLERREALFRTVSRLSLLGLFVLFVLYTLIRLSTPTFPWLPLFGVTAVLAVLITVSRGLYRAHRFETAVYLYLIGGAVSVAASGHFLGGVSGPLTQTYLALVLFGALLLGRRGVVVTAITSAALAGAAAFLERGDVIKPYPITPGTDLMLSLGVLWLALVVSVLLLSRFIGANQQAMTIVRERTAELVNAREEAEAAAQAEIEARRHESAAAQEVHRAVLEYTDFLQRVADGDYSTRLEMTGDENGGFSQELLDLGQYLNETVDSLVQAAEEAQAAQRIYVQQSWEALQETDRTPTGYLFREENVLVDEEAWLPAMEQALRERQLIADESGEVALPLDIRGEVIGALGLRRGDGGRGSWQQDDLLLIQDIADQLSQTIDRLRLLDETQRAALLEQTIGDVTARIRAEVEIEAIVERTLSELGRVLEAEQGTALLTLGDSEGNDHDDATS
jgi:hypothetical protein